ncbi:protein of unknown function (plasmid) [Caballeronia sp. S22]
MSTSQATSVAAQFRDDLVARDKREDAPPLQPAAIEAANEHGAVADKQGTSVNV